MSSLIIDSNNKEIHNVNFQINKIENINSEEKKILIQLMILKKKILNLYSQN